MLISGASICFRIYPIIDVIRCVQFTKGLAMVAASAKCLLEPSRLMKAIEQTEKGWDLARQMHWLRRGYKSRRYMPRELIW